MTHRPRPTRRDFTHQTLAATSAIPALAGIGIARDSHAAGDERIKVGQIGTTHAHASGQMATMRKFDKLFDVVGVVEPDEGRHKWVASNKAYRDVPLMSAEQLLNVKGLRCVAIETDIAELVPTAQHCADAGTHVFLDKPAGESLSAFKKLLDTLTAKKRVLQMGYMFRFNPAFELAFQAAREGWFGRIHEIHGVMAKLMSAGGRKSLEHLDGGTMFELSCHLIDPVVHMLGKPARVTPFNRKTRPKQDKLIDNQLAVLEYEHATVSIRSALVEYQGQRRRQFVVAGDKGVLDIKPLEPPRGTLTLDTDRKPYKKGSQDLKLPRPAGRYDGLWLDLAAMIRGEKKQAFTPEHDLAAHETVLRASGLPVD